MNEYDCEENLSTDIDKDMFTISRDKDDIYWAKICRYMGFLSIFIILLFIFIFLFVNKLDEN